MKKRSAGFRTMTLICVGVAGFVLIGIDGLAKSSPAPDAVCRIRHGLMTGIGLLGAGSIVRESGDVHGLTTPSAVCVGAANGAARGLGLFPLAVRLAAVTLFALIIMGCAEQMVERREGGEPSDRRGSVASDADP
jgi:putative Mg2+ transporter-C (MgtC) family protein